MTPLSITPNIEDAPWTDVAGLPLGMISRIGLQPRGMASGDPTATVLIALPDRTKVLAQTSWRLLKAACNAMDVSPIAPKLADIP